jgi:hypothetical protein
MVALRTGHLGTVDGPPLARGERRLVTVRGTGGTTVVATGRAVYHLGLAPPQAWQRLGWEQIGLVHWDERGASLMLTGWTQEAPRLTVLAVPRNHALVALARERVASTMLATTRLQVGTDGHVTLTARRQPGTDRLLWRVKLDDGVPDDPTVRADVEAAMARLRAELGGTVSPARTPAHRAG